MGYRLLGRLHVGVATLQERVANALLREQRGQGSVEYVALILLVAVVLAGVVAATKKANLGGSEIGAEIVKKLKSALEGIK